MNSIMLFIFYLTIALFLCAPDGSFNFTLYGSNGFFDPSMSEKKLISKLSELCFMKDPHLVYDFGPIIGKGKRGTVYKCKHKMTNEIRAIKMYPFTEKKHIAACYDELEISTHRLRHIPGMLQYYEGYVYDDKCWIVMEYVQGYTLNHLPKKQRTYSKIVHIVSQLFKVMERLNKQYLCHFDIKENNLMVTDQGEVILIDFSSMATLSYVPLPKGIKPSFKRKGFCNDKEFAIDLIMRLAYSTDGNKGIFYEYIKKIEYEF